MTAIAGAVQLDGRPADEALARRLLDALAHRGGTATVVCDGSAALGSRQRSNPQSHDGRGPIAVVHGSLYDRSEPRDTDAIVSAYERWGTACVARLDGEFAFALWDPAERRLVCGRDRMGVRPFYYAIVDGTFLFASELQALFAHPGLPRRPNLGFIGELLCERITSRTDSVFADVSRLAPAHALTAGGHGVTIGRYWSAGKGAAGEPSGTGADTIARCRELLERAVARRTKDERHVGVELSGGLDSSIVLALAAGVDARVRAYHVAHASALCDERTFARLSADAAGCELREVAPKPSDRSWFDREAAHSLDWPAGPNAGAMDRDMYAAAAADGVGVLLSGEGGDEWFTGSIHRYADMLSRGRVAELVSDLRHAPSLSRAAQRLWFAGAWPLLPPAVRTLARGLAGRRSRPRSVVPWLTPEFVRATALADRLVRPEYDPSSGLSRASWHIAQLADDGAQAMGFELSDRALGRFGLEERHPFYDREVIEFAVALPESMRYRRGETKWILREAMRASVPAPILARRDKADYTYLYVEALEAHGGASVFDDLAMAAEGWVDPAVLRERYRAGLAAFEAGHATPDVTAVWAVVAMDRWFRHVVLGPRATAQGVA